MINGITANDAAAKSKNSPIMNTLKKLANVQSNEFAEAINSITLVINEIPHNNNIAKSTGPNRC